MRKVNSTEEEQFKLNTTSTRTSMSKVTENTGIQYSEDSSDYFVRQKCLAAL